MQTYALVPNMKPCQTASLIPKAANLSEDKKNKTKLFFALNMVCVIVKYLGPFTPK